MAQSAASDHDLPDPLRAGDVPRRLRFHPVPPHPQDFRLRLARIRNDEPAYETAREFAREASEHGYMVITGGGPGIMQQPMKGRENNAPSA